MAADTRKDKNYPTNRFVRIALGAGMLFLVIVKLAYADMAYLTNGRKMECLLKTQGKDTVELEVEVGTIRLRSSEISRIERFSEAENRAMLKEWEEHKIKADIARRAWQQAEAARKEQELSRKESIPRQVDTTYENGHMIANARINGKVDTRLLIDTGASIVVMSRNIGEKLGLITSSDTQDGKGVNSVELSLADGRKVKAKYVMLESVSIQDARANNVEAAIMLDGKVDMPYDGVLGMSFLRRFNVQFNNKENRLILEKLK